MKSKTIVFPEKQQIAVWDEEVTPPSEGEVLCQAERSLVSIGTELNCLRGVFEAGTNWADWVKYPFQPGYSMVGRAIEIGKGVSGVQVGDRIATYDTHHQFYNVALNRRDVPEGIEGYVLPDAISSDDGTWRSLAVTTQNALRRADFRFGETACVVGLGILGQLVTQYLAAAGARRIIVIDPVTGRLELAKQNGATHTLALSAADALEPIRDITDGWLCDLVFDVTGHPAALAPCIPLVRRFGRLVLLGDTPTPSEQHLGPGVVSNSISIIGVHGFAVPDRTSALTPWSVKQMSDVFFDYVMRGKMNVSSLVTHHYSPLDAPDVYAKLMQDRSSALGVIFDWT